MTIPAIHVWSAAAERVADSKLYRLPPFAYILNLTAVTHCLARSILWLELKHTLRDAQNHASSSRGCCPVTTCE
ncbi:unnamed protein product [Chondrus crispus]|uniref:Uncharacterized protein n=1 Tax=Chondrus crispus TaxID=2769 RepID=R7QQM4_CHOCR|nr:unnamed protein product [Chondrus crispus]CDF39791.1 unnamed protein product [Chondrus crispus]|eukprot:XP_005710085.1 unnamed protein product [Chondrus crispus]